MADNEASSRTTKQKHQGAKTSVDVASGTKRRVDTTTSIRNKSRLEMMTKKRNEGSDNDNDFNPINPNGAAANNGPQQQQDGDNNVVGSAGSRNFPQPGTEEYMNVTNRMFQRIPDFVKMMNRDQGLQNISEGVWSIRRLLCHPERSPIQDLVQCGGIERLIDLLDAPDPNIQFNAAWSLTNISSGATSYASLIISHNAIPKFIGFLTSQHEKLREQSAWCLGNMAGDGQPIRDEILSAGVMQPLLSCLNDFNNAPATMHNATWLLAQLCRNKPSPPFEVVECCIPTVKRLLAHEMTEVQDDACWAISYLSDGPPSRINAVQKYDVFDTILNLLRSQRESVMLPAVRTFGNFSATNPEMTQIIIDQGILEHLGPLLNQSVSRQIRKEVCWLISNACAGYDNQVRAVMQAGLFPPVINNIFATEFEVRREAVWVVANATATADLERIRFLTERCDVLDGLCNVLATMDSRICNIALESIEAILQAGDTFRKQNGGINPYAARIEQNGGKENIGRLRDHVCHTVFVRSVTLMDRYFEDNWGQDDDDFYGEGSNDYQGGHNGDNDGDNGGDDDAGLRNDYNSGNNNNNNGGGGLSGYNI